ncbi:MAG TPA: HslU--HslV peptidase ATPase subunit, partial [Pyrinomonadaceae bacterium]|nr:HslU--HslV peptidase ATPase subunit [Pyrinomonadaceae bacterium]
QYKRLFELDDVTLEFTDDAVSRIAEMAVQINQTTEDIGARRLHTLLEKLLEDISFAGSDLEPKHQRLDAVFVSDRLGGLVGDQNLSRYIL